MDFKKLSREQMAIADMVVAAAEKYGIDPNLLLAQAFRESKFQHIPSSDPNSDAFGVMQIRPSTAAQNKLGDIRDLQTNIDAGARLMRQYLDQYKKPEAALLAYHQGPGVADEYIKTGQLKAAGPKGLDYVIGISEAAGLAPPSEEPRPGDVLKQPIPGLQKVLETESGPPGPPQEEVIPPEAGAAYGALANVGLQLLGTPPPAPKSTAEEKAALQSAREEYGTTTSDIQSKFQSAEEKANLKYQAALQEAQSKVDLAHQKLGLAQARLQQTMETPMGMPGGMTYAQADADFRAAQQEAIAAQQAYSQAQAAAKAKAPPPAAPAAPEIITDPNAPMQPPRTAEAQVFEGTIDPETGTTGRQRQVYSEVTSFQALQRREQERALREARERGLVPDIGESARLQFGAPTGTRSGILLQPQTAEPIKQQEALEQQAAEDRAAQERLAQAQEMERLKQEAILAKQRQAQAAKVASDIERFHQQRVSRAQSAGDTAVMRALEAKNALPIVQQQAQIDAQLVIDTANIARTQGLQAAQEALRKAEQAYPGFFERNMRKFESIGIASAPTGKFGLGATGRAISGGVLGTYGAMSVNELAQRYQQGDRDPELLKALAAATAATAGVVPALGPKTARLKGAGLMAAVPLMGYDLVKALSEEEGRLRMEEELKRRTQQAKSVAAP